MVTDVLSSTPNGERRQDDTSRDRLAGNALTEALELAARGYALTPVTIRRNDDGTKRAQFHARWSSATYLDRRTGQEVAGYSRVPDVIRDWSAQFGCSFGILCGPSGIEVVDLDAKHDAGAWWSAKELPVSPTVVDSPAGEHLYWRLNGHAPLTNNAGQVAPGVDARSVGGIVFAPGSFVLGVDGEPEERTYRARGPLPAPGDLEPTPDAVRELWTRAGTLPGSTESLHVPGPDSVAGPVGPMIDIESAGERRFTAAQAREFINREAREPLLTARFGQNVNSALNSAAVVLGHFVPEFLTHEQAQRWLVSTLLAGPGARAGWTSADADDLATIRSGLTAGMTSWEAVKAPETDPDVLTTEPAPEPGTDAFRAAVDARKGALRVRLAADREFAAEQRPGDPGPGGTSLGALLLAPDDEPDWRVGQLWPAGGKVLMSAPAKAGKTTTVVNLVRCLADGVPFLAGTTRPDSWKVATSGYPVTALDGRRVVLLDFEMTAKLLRRWYTRIRPANPDAVHVELMRGRRWDPRDDHERGQWAAHLRELRAGVLVVDPIGPVLQALGIEENSPTEVGAVLTALDMLAREAGTDGQALDLFVVQHTGHAGERARGASNFLGWPDAIWYLTRDEATDGRFLRAEGRDVLLPETQLEFDRGTGRLSLGQGSRASARALQDVDAVVAVVREEPAVTLKGIIAAFRENGIARAQRVQDAVSAAVAQSAVHFHKGTRGAHEHHLGASCQWCPGNSST